MDNTGVRDWHGRFKSAMTLADQFWTRVDKNGPVSDHRPDLGPCWMWLGKSDRYGRFHSNGAHRWAYQALIGQIPDGLQLDHICRVKRCVNPAHLEPVTPGENTRRGTGPSARAARATACPKGHPYDAANTFVREHNWRRCRACRTENQRRRRLALRAPAPQ